uniref:Septin 9a n=1 Tax=Nothobranchius furzeri TaxID=105023 RepID=A0A8C6LIR7_NOTFU
MRLVFESFSPYQCLIHPLSFCLSFYVHPGPEVFPRTSSSAMSEAVVPDTMVSPVVGSLYGEKTSSPVVDFSYVGIDAILEQMRRKAMKQGFELNIMVVGQSGLGKSTLMNTLFKSKVSRKSVLATAQEKIPKTIEIKSISHDVEEKGVRMKLTVIDTPGFGDQINNENCWQPIMKFINDQYEAYLQEEININRKKRIPDSRVHCCIYFIPPTGHCLRPLDVEFMRRLSKVVNIVPVIAKADTLTLEERDFFKKKIREELRANGIDVYPQKEFDEDAEDRMINEKIREMIPFAVVGSDQEYQVNGRRLLGRKTKWGTIEVENIAHCEFAYLRDLLIRTHMQNIKDITSSIHYEMYRVRRLNENNTAVAHANGPPAVPYLLENASLANWKRSRFVIPP